MLTPQPVPFETKLLQFCRQLNFNLFFFKYYAEIYIELMQQNFGEAY